MNKKLRVFSIFLGTLLMVSLKIDTGIVDAQETSTQTLPTYTEQQAYIDFIQQLEKQFPNENRWNKSRFVQNGGLPGSIRDYETYIASTEMLGKKQEEKPEIEVEPPKTAEKIVLTFDDGPHPKVTPRILAVLEKHQVKATFFMIGLNVAKYPEVAAQVAAAGHEVANHSWSHPNLTKLTTAQMNAEIDKTNEAIYEATGKNVRTYRPPYGKIDDCVRTTISLTPVLWNIDTRDWQHKTPALTLENVKQQAKADGILLMHDIHEESADALEAVILYLKQQGYEFVTASELLGIE